MSENINLIGKGRDESLREKKGLKYFKMTAIISLSIVLFCAVVLFIFKTSFGLPALTKQEQSLSSNISLLSDKTVKLLLVEERLRDISDIVKNRTDFNKTLDVITKDMSPGISVNSLSITQKKATLTVASYSLSDINVFLDSLQKTASEKKYFNKLVFDSLSVDDKTGKYSLGVTIDLL